MRAPFALMFAAAMATDRKTALLVPVAVVIYIACYRPRQVLRLAPIGLIALVGVVHLASPERSARIIDLQKAASSNSTTHRVLDFTDVAPDILAHPVLGRGFGTINPDQPSQFRINDNEYIDELWEVGAVGLVAFLWMLLAPVIAARAAIRTRGPTVASLALATSSGCVAFIVACALFDALSFPQAPYMFFTVAALTTIAAAGPEGKRAAEPRTRAAAYGASTRGGCVTSSQRELWRLLVLVPGALGEESRRTGDTRLGVCEGAAAAVRGHTGGAADHRWRERGHAGRRRQPPTARPRGCAP